ncbi:AFG1-family ATPase [Trifolium pratense]|uniref:AFG1-family ATPase n=1 Tax=Trifolium pratense TaxID=57577 RepID=A0A2K3MJL8_TRIPR|nr:AFG1-family ATPase [Trifolium pratense]
MRRRIWNLLFNSPFPTSNFRFTASRYYCTDPSRILNHNRPGPLVQYKNLVNQGKLQHDPYQETVATELQNLLARLENYERQMEEYHVNLSKWENSRENERRRILTEEVEKQQNDEDWWRRLNNKITERWTTNSR